MTLKQFTDKIRVMHCHMGEFKVEIIYRGKVYNCWSNNTQAYDAIMAWKRDWEPAWGYTPKQAYQALWDECVRNIKLL